MKVVEKKDTDGFSHIVRDTEGIIYLQINKKLHNSKKFEMKPNKRYEPIYANLNNGDWFFITNDACPISLRWIAELKKFRRYP